MHTENADYGLASGPEEPPSSIVVGAFDYDLSKCAQDKDGVDGIGVLAITVGFFIMLMNLLAIMLIIRNRNLHRAIYFCICNLALADMLAGFLLFWIFYLQKKFLPFRSSYSDLIQKSIWIVTIWSSFLNQLLIAVDCYCICRKGSPLPKKDKFGNKARKWGIISGLVMTWLIPITTLLVPVASVWHCANHCHCYKAANATSDVIYMFCFPLDQCSMTNPPFTKSSMMFMGLFLVAMPIVPCVLYGKIFKIVRDSTNRLRLPRSKNSIPSTSGDFEMNNIMRSAAPSTSGNANADDSFASSSQIMDYPAPGPDANCVNVPDRIYQARESLTEQNDSVFNTYAKRKSSNTSKGNPGTSVASADAITIRSTHQPQEEKRKFLQMRRASSAFLNVLRINDRDIALFKTLVVILACYVISTVPLGILFLISFGEPDKRFVEPAKVLLIISLINSLLNPIIYMMRFKEMKKDFKKMFCFYCNT